MASWPTRRGQRGGRWSDGLGGQRVTGLLVAPGTLTRCGRLQALLDDPAPGKVSGAAGLARAHRRFGWDRVAAQTESVYRRTAAREQHQQVSPVGWCGERSRGRAAARTAGFDRRPAWPTIGDGSGGCPGGGGRLLVAGNGAVPRRPST